MVEVMKIMVTSFKGPLHILPHSVPLTCSRPTPLLETPGHSWASLGQSAVGSVSPGSWCAQDLACALQASVSPVIRKFWCKTLGPGVYKV